MTHENNLQALLYTLMRDTIVPGELEREVTDQEKHPGPYSFSNSHLAAYALELARRVLGPQPTGQRRKVVDDAVQQAKAMLDAFGPADHRNGWIREARTTITDLVNSVEYLSTRVDTTVEMSTRTGEPEEREIRARVQNVGDGYVERFDFRDVQHVLELLTAARCAASTRVDTVPRPTSYDVLRYFRRQLGKSSQGARSTGEVKGYREAERVLLEVMDTLKDDPEKVLAEEVE